MRSPVFIVSSVPVTDQPGIEEGEEGEEEEEEEEEEEGVVADVMTLIIVSRQNKGLRELHMF